MTQACALCGSSDLVDIIPRVNDHITNDEFRVVRCRTCDVRFTWPRPQQMDRYYPSAYRGYSGLTRAALQALYRWRVRGWLSGAAPGDALEVGCGPGLMLDALRARGWRVMGTERTPEAAAYARDELGLDVVAGEVDDVPADRRFDLIILFQVLEHMHAPQHILDECAKRLKPGGRVIVDVPNADSWQARFGGRYWVHLDPPRHLFHFTPRSLQGAFERTGLVVCGVAFMSFEHDPFGWVQSAINRLTGRPNVLTRFLMGMERGSGGVLLSGILAALFAVPALVLALVSWPAQRGALMEMRATTAEGVTP